MLELNGSLPVIMFGSEGEFPVRSPGLNRAKIDYLLKPVELDVLLNAVSRVLN